MILRPMAACIGTSYSCLGITLSVVRSSRDGNYEKKTNAHEVSSPKHDQSDLEPTGEQSVQAHLLVYRSEEKPSNKCT